jgi:hypothetical protein
MALRRNVYADGDERGNAARLAAYVLEAAKALAALPLTEIADGTPAFPDPAPFVGR